MKNIFQKFLTNKKNRKLTIGNQNEFQGIISPVSPVAIVDEPITFSSDVDFTNANVIGIDTTPDTSGLWNLDGNSIQSGDFIGTTNNERLILKTNNTNVATFPRSTTDAILIGKNTSTVTTSSIIIGNQNSTNFTPTQTVSLGNEVMNFTQAANSSAIVAIGNRVARNLQGSGVLAAGYGAGQDINLCTNTILLGYNCAKVTGNPAPIPLNISNDDDINWTETTPGVWTKTGSTTGRLLIYKLLSEVGYPNTVPAGVSIKVSINATVTAGSIQLTDSSSTLNTISSTGSYFSLYNVTTNAINLYIQPSADFQGTVSVTITAELLRILDYSILIGADSKPKDNLDTNEIVIGYNAVGNGSNTATLGNDSIANTYLKGNLQLPAYGDGNVTGTATKLLGVDTNGKVVETPYAGYKVYTARVMFNGVNGFPVPTILENTLGGSPAWSKDATGTYSVVLSNAFPDNKTFISYTQVYGAQTHPNTKQVFEQAFDNSTLQITNYDLTSTPALLDISTTTPMFVEIRVYP